MLRFKCYGLRFEWLKLKFNSGFYPREGRYAVLIIRTIRATSSQGRLPQLAPRRCSGTRHRPRRALGAAIPTDGVATNTRHRVSVI